MHNAIWGLIDCSHNHSQEDMLEQAVIKKVKDEIGIKLKKIILLSSSANDSFKTNYYYSELTDQDVNEITRDDHQLVNFFSLAEVDTLQLSPVTQSLLSRHRDILTKSHN